jgi:integrase
MKVRRDKPEKPYSDFPLFPHATRRWAKKIRCKLRYFGPWTDEPDRGAMWALARYNRIADDLHAGREPRPDSEGLTVADLCNHFMTSKRHLRESSEITDRTWRDYYSTCERVVAAFGRNRVVTDLTPADFEQLRASLAKTRGPVALGNEIQRVRMIFKYGYDQELLDRPIRYGQTFKKPSLKTVRRARATRGPRMLSNVELREILGAAKPHMKAMVLLGINCGFGQTDLSNLPQAALDLDNAWVDFPREKTSVARRCPLWPETITAVREYLPKRPMHRDDADAELVFVTKYGQRWVKTNKSGTPSDALGQEFSKLLTALELKRPGISFYALRHTFETVAGESRDQIAVDYIMGHAPAKDDMAAVYRQAIGDERLKRVTDHVHGWLFGSDSDTNATSGATF